MSATTCKNCGSDEAFRQRAGDELLTYCSRCGHEERVHRPREKKAAETAKPERRPPPKATFRGRKRK